MSGLIHNGDGERLDHTFTPGDQDCRDLVVIGHGVTGNKDRPWAVALATALAASGYPSLRFSFAGNGASGGDFEAATLTKEVADLGAVLDALHGWRVVYAGHSMGAAVGVLRAALDPRIGALVSLAGMVDTAAFAERKFGGLEPGRDVMWDKPECPLSRRFIDDMNAIGDLREQARAIDKPWLLVHGRADTVVPFAESLALSQGGGGNLTLVALEGADHVFSGKAEDQMTRAVLDWLQRVRPH